MTDTMIRAARRALVDPGTRRPRRARRSSIDGTAWTALGVAALVLLIGAALSGPPAAFLFDGSYGICGNGMRIDCVVDGDTFHHHGTRIRIADIDAPETHPPRCATEAVLGRRATERLRELLNAGPFVLERWPGRDEDHWGRKLRIVTRNGHSLGARLVAEGLARPWTGRRFSWCDGAGVRR